MCRRVSRILHHAHDADRIVRPTVSLALDRAVHRELHNTLFRQIHRVEARYIVRARRDERIRPERNRARKNVSAVVVRVFADEIHAPRRKICVRLGGAELLPKHLVHLVQNCHRLHPPFIFG